MKMNDKKKNLLILTERISRMVNFNLILNMKI